MSDGYNGWRNRNTWLVNLYVDGNYDGSGTADHYFATASRACAGNETREAAIDDLASCIEADFTVMFGDAEDKLGYFLADFFDTDDIDYRAIAEGLIDAQEYSFDGSIIDDGDFYKVGDTE